MFRVGFLILFLVQPALALVSFNDYEQPPHNYDEGEFQDPFSILKRQIEAGEKTPDQGSARAYFDWLLAELDLSPASQMLVFSRTGLQRKVVSPHNPRALFFNEQTYLTYIPGGRIEVASYDPLRGPMFYILEGTDTLGRVEEVRFNRRQSCLDGCHAGSATNFLPGLLARSLYVNEEGTPAQVDLSGVVVNAIGNHENMFHTMPLRERWGGWYVTGAPPSIGHLGNVVFPVQGGAPVLAVGVGSRRAEYPHGDSSQIVTLLLHDHQIGVLNTLYETFYRWRTALFLQNEDRIADGLAPLAQLEESQAARLEKHLERTVRQLLFCDEAPLPAEGLRADPLFVVGFHRGTPRDGEGRSLKDLDLQSRLMKHPCSYVVQSPQVAGLPAPFRSLLFERLRAVLRSSPAADSYGHLTAADRRTIDEILTATLPGYEAENGGQLEQR